MKADRIYDPESLYDAGIMMGFHQNADGALSWGYGQHYAKYDLLGRKVFNRRLPANYADFSHAMMPAENGGYFLRVASPDLRRADDTRVRTVRDVIIEVDAERARSSTNGASSTFSIRTATSSSRRLTRAPSASTSTRRKSGKTLSAEAARQARGPARQFGDIAGIGCGPQLGPRQLRRL